VRIVAATHRDLHQEVAEGRFREDLFYRLSVLVLKMPPLRERADDIPLLVRHVVARLAGDMGLPVPSDWDDELAMLGDHDWPGNVRELRNVIERSLLLGCPPSRCLNMRPNGGSCLPQRSDEGDWRLTTIEQRHIRAVLEATQGNKSEAARRLGISRKTLERKLKAWACAAPQQQKSI
jgi:two-component system NtrC family response regulator